MNRPFLLIAAFGLSLLFMKAAYSASSLEDGLIGHWSFDEEDDSSIQVRDVSGNGMDGLLSCSPEPGPTECTVYGSPKKPNGAIALSGPPMDASQPVTVSEVWRMRPGARSPLDPSEFEVLPDNDRAPQIIIKNFDPSKLYEIRYHVKNSPMAREVGIRGKAMRFDGVDDWVSIYRIEDLQKADSRAVSFWIHPESGASRRGSASIFGTATPLGYGFAARYNDDGTLNLLHMGIPASMGDPWKQSSYFGGTTIPSDAWSHVVLQVGHGVATCWINGELAGTVEGRDGMIRAIPENTVRIGSGLNGLLDEIRLYNRTLTREEIVSLYKNHR